MTGNAVVYLKPRPKYILRSQFEKRVTMAKELWQTDAKNTNQSVSKEVKRLRRGKSLDSIYTLDHLYVFLGKLLSNESINPEETRRLVYQIINMHSDVLPTEILFDAFLLQHNQLNISDCQSNAIVAQRLGQLLFQDNPYSIEFFNICPGFVTRFDTRQLVTIATTDLSLAQYIFKHLSLRKKLMRNDLESISKAHQKDLLIQNNTAALLQTGQITEANFPTFFIPNNGLSPEKCWSNFKILMHPELAKHYAKLINKKTIFALFALVKNRTEFLQLLNFLCKYNKPALIDSGIFQRTTDDLKIEQELINNALGNVYTSVYEDNTLALLEATSTPVLSRNPEICKQLYKDQFNRLLEPFINPEQNEEIREAINFEKFLLSQRSWITGTHLLQSLSLLVDVFILQQQDDNKGLEALYQSLKARNDLYLKRLESAIHDAIGNYDILTPDMKAALQYVVEDPQISQWFPLNVNERKTLLLETSDYSARLSYIIATRNVDTATRAVEQLSEESIAKNNGFLIAGKVIFSAINTKKDWFSRKKKRTYKAIESIITKESTDPFTLSIVTESPELFKQVKKWTRKGSFWGLRKSKIKRKTDLLVEKSLILDARLNRKSLCDSIVEAYNDSDSVHHNESLSLINEETTRQQLVIPRVHDIENLLSLGSKINHEKLRTDISNYLVLKLKLSDTESLLQCDSDHPWLHFTILSIIDERVKTADFEELRAMDAHFANSKIESNDKNTPSTHKKVLKEIATCINESPFSNPANLLDLDIEYIAQLKIETPCKNELITLRTAIICKIEKTVNQCHSEQLLEIVQHYQGRIETNADEGIKAEIETLLQSILKQIDTNLSSIKIETLLSLFELYSSLKSEKYSMQSLESHIKTGLLNIADVKILLNLGHDHPCFQQQILETPAIKKLVESTNLNDPSSIKWLFKILNENTWIGNSLETQFKTKFAPMCETENYDDLKTILSHLRKIENHEKFKQNILTKIVKTYFESFSCNIFILLINLGIFNKQTELQKTVTTTLTTVLRNKKNGR